MHVPYLQFFSALRTTLVDVAVGGGYVTLFLTTFLEGLPLIGILIPGHVVIIAAGFISATGILNIWVTLAIAVVGAIGGDFMSFALGRHYGWPLVDRLRRYFFLRDEHIDKAKRLLGTHTGKSLIIGRFNPVTRGIMPFLVGAAGTPSGSFWLFNIAGALLWVVLSVGLGYVLGFGYQASAGFVGQMVLVSIIAGILIAWGYHFINSRFHIFSAYELFALILNLISLFVLARMLQDAFSAQSFMANFDIWVNGIFLNLMSGNYGPRLVSTALAISTIGGVEVVSTLTVIIGLFLVFSKKWRSAAILLLSVGAAAFWVGWIKDFFLRIRPEDMYAPLWPVLGSDPSFPSAHAAFIAAFLVALVYLIAPRIRSWIWREILVTASVLAVIIVGLSRLILNVHWTSDVIAGWALGIFCATASILLVKYVGKLVS